MILCTHAKPIGYVSNQPDEYDHDRDHASTTVCEREACIEAAKAWVLKKTKEAGEFRHFKAKP